MGLIMSTNRLIKEFEYLKFLALQIKNEYVKLIELNNQYGQRLYSSSQISEFNNKMNFYHGIHSGLNLTSNILRTNIKVDDSVVEFSSIASEIIHTINKHNGSQVPHNDIVYQLRINFENQYNNE